MKKSSVNTETKATVWVLPVLVMLGLVYDPNAVWMNLPRTLPKVAKVFSKGQLLKRFVFDGHRFGMWAGANKRFLRINLELMSDKQVAELIQEIRKRGLGLSMKNNLFETDGRYLAVFDNVSDAKAWINQESVPEWINTYKAWGVDATRLKSDLSNAEWELLGRQLKEDGIGLEVYKDNGIDYVHFVKLDEVSPEDIKLIKRGSGGVGNVDSGAVTKMLRDKFFVQDGIFVSKEVYSGGTAAAMVEKLRNDGFVAVSQGTKGVSRGEEYVVVAVQEDVATQYGVLVETGNKMQILRPVNKVNEWKRAEQYASYARPLLNDADGMVQLVDVGVHSGRPIALVNIVKYGKNAVVPFYISTGSAGKTDVVTGMWEPFGGISGNWFVKGNIQSINNFYGCSQLRKIADALDRNLGDLRDVELVLESMGRASVGGQGKVMVAGENTGKYLDANYINQGFYELGNRDITVYVRKLKQLFGWY